MSASACWRGSIVDSNALLRSYIWHCIAIPLIAGIFMAVHFWRVRKDGGISGPSPVMLESEIKERTKVLAMVRCPRFEDRRLFATDKRENNEPQRRGGRRGSMKLRRKFIGCAIEVHRHFGSRTLGIRLRRVYVLMRWFKPALG